MVARRLNRLKKKNKLAEVVVKLVRRKVVKKRKGWFNWLKKIVKKRC